MRRMSAKQEQNVSLEDLNRLPTRMLCPSTRVSFTDLFSFHGRDIGVCLAILLKTVLFAIEYASPHII
jgi:hypothetical protein